jgi:hypothetical protein
MEKQNRPYNLIVAGGGISGTSAAVAASRRGLRVLLVEQSSMLGGMGTGGLVTMMMTSRSWFYGIGRKLIDKMIAQGNARLIPNPAIKGFDYYPFDAEAMKRELDRLVLESGAELLLCTKIIGTEKKDGKITALHMAGVEGKWYVCADYYIDATGDGRLAALAGETVSYGDKNFQTQAPTMMAYYAGIDFDKYERFLETFEDGKRAAKINMIHTLLPQAVKEGVVSQLDLHHPGVFRISEQSDVGMMNVGHVYGADCSTSRGMTEAVVRGRRMAFEYNNFYRKYIPGFENAYMTNTGSILALRETGRVTGLYETTFEDKSNYVKFPDAVMRFDGGAVSDVHAASASKEAYQAYVDLYAKREQVRSDDYATLPYRSIITPGTNNLLLAGRCVSADRKVLGQIRLMSYCFMMGEAAGVAASIAQSAQQAVWDVSPTKLQTELKKNDIETI